MRHVLVLLSLILILTAPVTAENRSSSVSGEVTVNNVSFQTQRQGLNLRGTGTATWKGIIDVYVAALYARSNTAPQGVLDAGNPVTLEIGYLRSVKKEEIIKAAMIALEAQNTPEVLTRQRSNLQRLHSVYSDVAAGDYYRMDLVPGKGLHLYFNDKQVVIIDDEAFGRLYLGIWLNEPPLSKALRNALLDWQV